MVFTTVNGVSPAHAQDLTPGSQSFPTISRSCDMRECRLSCPDCQHADHRLVIAASLGLQEEGGGLRGERGGAVLRGRHRHLRHQS